MRKSSMIAAVIIGGILAASGTPVAAVPRGRAEAAGTREASPPDKPAVLARLTGPSAESYREWNEARLHPERWSAYDFIWTTDYCTDGPDRPAGFDFRMACRRHDFGYRNYKAIREFEANRARLDRTFHADLRRRCATYAPALRPLCSVFAWTYYKAARRYGGTKVTDAA